MIRLVTRPVYFFKMAANNISRNVMLNIISAATIALALMIQSSFVLIHINLKQLVDSTTEGLAVSVYLKDDLLPKDLESLEREIAGLPGVSALGYVSKSRALEDLKRRLGDSADLIDGLETNPLPASLELELDPEYRSVDKVANLTGTIQGLHGVAEVHYAWDWAEKLRVVIHFFKIGGLVVGGLLFLAIVFIIANTIRLTVMARRDELYILRLMGATEGFIRTPFILEGMFQGLVGGLMALAGLFLLFWLMFTQVQLPLGFSMIQPTFLSAGLSWALVGVGVVLGFAGSFVSLGRFMHA